MPTIEFSYRDFQELLGRNLPVEEFKELAILYAKAEVEGYDKGTIKLALDDTNMPYLWCVEGLARFFRGVLEIEKGLPKIRVSESKFKVTVDVNVKKFRPYIATFVADGKVLDNYLLEQLVQLQEKFCEGYGRRREKVSIGLYSHRKIKFPVHYRAVKPDSVRFTPLEMKSDMNLSEIVEKHPKGRDYGWVIKKLPLYPMLMDDNGEVMSLVPIINSNFTGKLVVGDRELMFEATGTDYESVNLAASIFAQNLYERGFKIHSIIIDYGSRKEKTPHSFNEKVKLDMADVESLTGLKLSDLAVKKLLERARYGVSGNSISIPDYRRDILHFVDMLEDVAIMYGFDRIESAPLTSYTIGSATKMNGFVDKAREVVVGLGFQEVLSPVLSNKAVLEERMGVSGTGLVEIENAMSETFSAVRSWLTPVMMEVLSKNKHRDFPQRIFEQGIVNVRNGDKILGREVVALAVSHAKTDFTEIKQCLDAIMGSFGLKYSIEASDMPSFINGRGAKVKAGGKCIGMLGEVSPKVLVNWGLETPVSALELDLTDIERIIS